MDRTKSIDLLNKAVNKQLQVVHQYMYFLFHLADQGFEPLAKLFERAAFTELGHVEFLAERVLFLEGDVEMVPAGPVEKTTEPLAILAKAMVMEQESAEAYYVAALECGANADAASKKIFELLVGDEERYYGQFAKHQESVKHLGLSYFALEP